MSVPAVQERRVQALEAETSTSGFFRLWIPSHLVFIACSLGTYGLNWWLAQSRAGSQVLGPTAAASTVVGLVVVVALAGAIDRSRRLTFLFTLEAVTAASSLLLLICYVAGSGSWVIVAAGGLGYLLIYSAQLVYQAGLETTLADLAPGRWPTTRTATLIQLQPFTTRFAAILIGGPLLVIGLLWTLPVIAAAAAATTAICMFALPVTFRQPAADRREAVGPAGLGRRVAGSLLDARESWSFIRERPVLLFITATALLNNLLTFPVISLLAVFIGSLHLPNPTAAYGQANFCFGACLLTGSVLFSRFGRPVRRPILWSSLGELGVVVSLLLATLATSSAFLAVCIGLFALSNVVLASVAGSVWLSSTPAAVRVRVFSLRRLSQVATVPIGGTVLGVFGALFGFSLVLRLVLAVVIVGLAAAWLAVGWRRLSGRAG